MGMKKASILKDVPITSSNGSIPPIPEIPSLPVLPETSVNPQPRNEESPVKPALKRFNENGKTGTDTMSKIYWAEKNRKEDIRAILNTTVASPVVAQICIGKNESDVLKTIRTVFEFNLALYDEKIDA